MKNKNSKKNKLSQGFTQALNFAVSIFNDIRFLFTKILLGSNLSKKNLVSGFTLLFASLIGSLVFTIGIAILNISLKQLALTNAGRESQQAFYSADAGVECALFLDRGAGDGDCQTGFFGVASSTSVRQIGIAICNKDSQEYLQSPSASQKCFGKAIDIDSKLASSNTVVNTFELTNNTDTNICFSVTVTKMPNPNNLNDPSDMQSIVESRGYSRCKTGPDDAGAIYERAIKTYNY
ncbi:MAG: hypothetical protein JWP09_703 [Candidatus Taylorbacteria bacterium]|nr:hypothetical protein [Candidatus Taylorbacteria bacterium]